MLREAQAGAYWAVLSHFTARSGPAIVVMPTGSGKTAVMTLVALGLTRKRLLIIAPAVVVRDQIGDEFTSLHIAREAGCVPADVKAPKVAVVSKKLSAAERWLALEPYDVVISTPKCVSPSEKGVYEAPPKDLFDTVFFDEAHHLPARTWDALVTHFADARVVTFTATPFRNDKKPIPGEIVYSYPLGRAIQRGIYRPIEFVPVGGQGTKEERHRRLAREARRTLEREPDRRQAKLLVRAGRLKDTEDIQSLYAEQGLSLEIVTSKRTWSVNRAAIGRAAQDDTCHGLICVGMLGEGLDLPALRIAVMHEPHQSFPVTLQFIGRVCRTSGAAPHTAKLLAIPEDIQDHTKGLYEADANWAKLIPNLADAAVEKEQRRRIFVEQRLPSRDEAGDVSMLTLRPSFSVVVYDGKGESADISAIPKLSSGTHLVQSSHSPLRDGKEWRVLITRSIGRPAWTTSDALLDVNSDLHIYYRTNRLLFEFTTAPPVARDIRRSFAETAGRPSLTPLPKRRIEQAVSQGDVDAYFNVGMRRVAYTSSAIPSYKMVTGMHAENTIKPSDGTFFAVGHVFGRVALGDDRLALGVSGQSGKIWSSARGYFEEFAGWCDSLEAILTNQLSKDLPHLEHLRQPQKITALPARPYAATLSEDFFEHLQRELRMELRDRAGRTTTVQGDPQFELSVGSGSWTKSTPDKCRLTLKAGNVSLGVQYDARTDPPYSLQPGQAWERCTVKVREKGRFPPYDLADYFALFTPVLFLTDGSAVIGTDMYRDSPSDRVLPTELCKTVDWSALRCDITVEEGQASPGKCSVLQATAKLLPQLLGEGTIIFYDHHAGEIADYVAFEPQPDRLHVHLIHCKASHKSAPGARQQDAFELLGQARKCTRWIRRSDLLDIVKNRMGSAPARILQGSLPAFEHMVATKSRGTAAYTVHIVQPGFDIAKIQGFWDESIRLMILSLYEELVGQEDVTLRVIGS